MCFFCNKLHVSQFRGTYKSVDDLVLAMAHPLTGPQLSREVVSFRALIVEAVIAQNKYNIRIDVSMADRIRALKHKKVVKTHIIAPVDQVVDPDYYIANFNGHWTTNGSGHRYGTIDGITGVIVPGVPIHQIQRISGHEAEMEETIDDGSVQLTEQAMDQKFETLKKDIDIPMAVGQAMNLVQNPSGGAASGSQSSGGPRATAASSGAPSKSLPQQQEGVSPSNTFGIGFAMMDIQNEPLGGKPADHTQNSEQGRRVDLENPPSKGKKTAIRAVKDPATPNSKKSAQPAGSPSVIATPKGGRGRRPDEPLALTMQQCVAFKDAEEDDVNFFGAGVKSHKSYLKRIKDKVEQRTSSEQEAEEIRKFTLAFKRMTFIVDVHDIFLKHGLQSKIFNDFVQQKYVFLKMEPAIDDMMMPRFMLKKHNEFKAVGAKNGLEFWHLMTNAVLVSIGFTKEGFVAERTRNCTLRVISLTRSDPPGGSATALLDLTVSHTPITEKSELPVDLEDLNVIARASLGKDLPTSDAISNAYARAHDPANTILNALKTFSIGRMILAAAKDRKDTIDQTTKTTNLSKFQCIAVAGDKWTIAILESFLKLFEDLPEMSVGILQSSLGLELERVGAVLQTRMQKCVNAVISLEWLHVWGATPLCIDGTILLKDFLKTMITHGDGFYALMKSTCGWFSVIGDVQLVFVTLPESIAEAKQTLDAGLESLIVADAVRYASIFLRCMDEQVYERIQSLIGDNDTKEKMKKLLQMDIYDEPMSILLNIYGLPPLPPTSYFWVCVFGDLGCGFVGLSLWALWVYSFVGVWV